MRFAAGLLGLTFCWLTLVGCHQTCFVQEPDLLEAQRRLHLPPMPENDPTAGLRPLLPKMGNPATVVDPDRKPRYITLQEALAIALENGTSGVQSVRSPGIPIDDLVTFTGNGVAGSDRIRVFALSPAVNAAIMEGSLARFDPQWVSSMNWLVNDNPVQGLNSFTNGEQGSLSTSLVKPLPTGGTAGITFSANYLDLRNPPAGFFFLNPSYTTNLQLGFEQPLLRYAGTAINQLLPSGPLSNLFSQINSRPALSSTEGILITRIRFDQQRADFERRINFLLLNVEVAYWNLYGAYVTLFSADQGLRQATESWRILNDQQNAGKADPAQLPQVRSQYEQFRISRLTAIDTVLENERILRIFLGMKMEDGERLVPADAPTLAPYVPNWEAALQDALTLRPELVMAREDVKAKQFAVVAAKTLLQPDLRFSSTYTLVGLGSRLDGGGLIAPGSPINFNSLATLASGNFVNWNLGLNMIVPIGFRNELAQVRAARLALAQSLEVLKDQENKAHNNLARQYREVIATYKIIEARRLLRQTRANELRILTSKVESGVMLPTDRAVAGYSGDSLLDAQNLWATALSDEYTAIVNYNVALAQFEFAKGTIQHHDRIQIAEGQIPKGAQVRAVEHERERTRAIVIRERTNPLIQRPANRLMPDTTWPDTVAPPLPALWKDGPPVDKNDPGGNAAPGMGSTGGILSRPELEGQSSGQFRRESMAPMPAVGTGGMLSRPELEGQSSGQFRRESMAPMGPMAPMPVPAGQVSKLSGPVPDTASPARLPSLGVQQALPVSPVSQDLARWLAQGGSPDATLPKAPPLSPRVNLPPVAPPSGRGEQGTSSVSPPAATPPLVPRISRPPEIRIQALPGGEEPASPPPSRLGLPGALRELPEVPTLPHASGPATDLPRLGVPTEP